MNHTLGFFLSLISVISLVRITDKSGGCHGIHRSSMDDCCVAIISLSPIPLSCQPRCHPCRRNDTQGMQASGRQ